MVGPLVPVELGPHAAARHNPTVASASTRKREPKCIRVLPLWFFPAAFFPHCSRDAGRECAGCRSYSHGLFGHYEFCWSGVNSVKSPTRSVLEHPFDKQLPLGPFQWVPM